MFITLTQAEGDCLRNELDVHSEEQLANMLKSLCRDAGQFIDVEFLADGGIQIQGDEVFIMNVFSLMKDKVKYIAGMRITGIGVIKTGMSLFNDIKRDYNRAIELSRKSRAVRRSVQDDFDEIGFESSRDVTRGKQKRRPIFSK